MPDNKGILQGRFRVWDSFEEACERIREEEGGCLLDWSRFSVCSADMDPKRRIEGETRRKKRQRAYGHLAMLLRHQINNRKLFA